MNAGGRNARVELLLAILSNLKRHDVVSLKELATQLDMSEAALADEVEALLFVGVPPFGGGDLLPLEFEKDEDGGGGFLCVTGDMPALDAPLRLTEDEARALVLALRIAGFEAGDPLVEKLTAGVTVGFDADTLGQMIHIASAGHNVDVFRVLSEALDAGRAVEIAYLNRRDEHSVRMLEPWTLFAESSEWYVSGYDRRRAAVRNFRVGRIESARLCEERAGTVGAGAPAAGAADADATPAALDVDALPSNCRLRFHKPGAFRAAEWPGARIVSQRGGMLEIDVPYGEPGWMAHKVMALHGQAEVRFPDEMRAALQEAARSALAALGTD